MVVVPVKLTLLALPPLLLASAGANQAIELAFSDSKLAQLDMTAQEAIVIDSECSEEDDRCGLALRQLRIRTHKEAELASDSMTNSSCSAHSGCAALSGNCCPNPAGIMLSCCSQTGAKHPAAATQPSPSPKIHEVPSISSNLTPSSPAMPVLKSSAGISNLKTAYHITNPEAGASILKSAFRPGSRGWCGGAIYFAPDPTECWHKAAPGMLAKGIFMIEVVVDLGRTKTMSNTCTSPSYCTLTNIVYCGCDTKNRGAEMASQGYDSMIFNPGDGVEYIIWDPSRVKSMKRIPWPPGVPLSPPVLGPPPASPWRPPAMPPPPPPSPWGYYRPYYW